MSKEKHQASITTIQTSIEKVNIIAKRGGKLEPVFRLNSIPSLEFTCYEAGFLRIVSWLYIMLYEAARADIMFLLEKMRGFGLDVDGNNKDYFRLIHSLRTNLQHGMNFESIRNNSLKQMTEQWFTEVVQFSYPSTPVHWKKCLNALLSESVSFFTITENIVRTITSNDDSQQLVRSWNQYASHFHEPSDFDQVIYNVAREVGIQVDVIKHRNKHFELWAKKIEALPLGYNFETEARKMVQKTLLEDPPLPITTLEIIEKLNIPAGPKVGFYLKQAKQIYFETPCSSEELLEQLKKIQR